jgi:hypothetical protein
VANDNGTAEADDAAAQQLKSLAVTFKDRSLTFRHFPNAKCPELRWQAVRQLAEPIILPDGTITLVERLELVGFARTSQDLIEQLA